MTEASPAPEVLDCAALARRIGKTEHWVRRNARHLPHHRYGRSYRFDAEDVAAIKDMHRKRPEAQATGEQLRPIGHRRTG